LSRGEQMAQRDEETRITEERMNCMRKSRWMAENSPFFLYPEIIDEVSKKMSNPYKNG
jgi:hypothetical protein